MKHVPPKAGLLEKKNSQPSFGINPQDKPCGVVDLQNCLKEARMDGLIYTYALIKTLYDQGEDYIDSFWPFAIKTFAADAPADCPSIQRNLAEKFSLNVPQHVLTRILLRAQTKGYIERTRGQFKLTRQGLKYVDGLESDKEVERRISALLDDIKAFCKERNINLDPHQIRDSLLAFVNRNLEPLVELISPRASSESVTFQRARSHEKVLVEYIRLAERQKPNCYKTLEELVLGSLISAVLRPGEPEELLGIKTRKFKHCQIFLDANFVFCLLDLDRPDQTTPARELFSLLKKYPFELKVFSFTVDEMCRVVAGYARESHRYPISINVDSLYSSLKRKGWKKSHAKEFIINIEDTLKKEGIQVEWMDVDLAKYQPPDPALRSAIRKYKPHQDTFHQNHDLAAIHSVKDLRAKPVRRIEEAKILFLTSDRRLSRFNFLEMGHRNGGTVGEAILDRLLTNTLWLKNPTTELPLKCIISAYSRDLFINKRIWDTFYEVLQELREDTKVVEDNISMLFYHSYIEDVLTELDEDDVGKITPAFVLEEIEKAAQFQQKKLKSIEEAKDEEAARKIREKEGEFLKQLKKVISQKDRDKETEWSDNISIIKSNLRKAAESTASKLSFIGASVVTLLILWLAYRAYLFCKHKDWIDLFVIGVPLLIGGSGVASIWAKLRTLFQSSCTERLYRRKVSEAKLDRFELGDGPKSVSSNRV